MLVSDAAQVQCKHCFSVKYGRHLGRPHSSQSETKVSYCTPVLNRNETADHRNNMQPPNPSHAAGLAPQRLKERAAPNSMCNSCPTQFSNSSTSVTLVQSDFLAGAEVMIRRAKLRQMRTAKLRQNPPPRREETTNHTPKTARA